MHTADVKGQPRKVVTYDCQIGSDIDQIKLAMKTMTATKAEMWMLECASPLFVFCGVEEGDVSTVSQKYYMESTGVRAVQVNISSDRRRTYVTLVKKRKFPRSKER